MSEFDLLPLLATRLRGAFSPILADTSATILLTAGGLANWTLLIDQGRITARRGAPGHPTTTITAAVDVLGDVVSGKRSGTQAFLAGELIVRGNMALSLQLDGLFVSDEQPEHMIRTRVVHADGVDTFFLDSGPADAPPVVLIHGLGATNASMLPLLSALSHDYRVIAPDLPGHGASSAGRENYGAQFLGKWLAAFVEASCDGQRPVLVGNSLGGRTALEAAMLSPDLARGLVLLCPAVALRKLRQFVPLVRLVRPELAAVKVRIPRRMALRGLRSLFADPDRIPAQWLEAAVDEFIRVLGLRSGRVAFFSALRAIYLDEPFGEQGFWQRLGALQPKALFVWGEKDILVPAGFSRHVADAIPSAVSIVLADCGHVPQFEFRERTAEIVLEFLDELDYNEATNSSAAK